jgi:hypothetical protein
MRFELPAWNVRGLGGVGIELARIIGKIEPDNVQGSGCFIHPRFNVLYY